MSEKKSLVEETLLHMRNLEEAIQSNAKGILASTMKEEIGELVKESLSETNEQEEEDIEVDDTTDIIPEPEDEVELDDVSSDIEMDVEDIDAETLGADMNVDMDTEEDALDLTDISDEELLTVFKAMGDEDNIIVKKEADKIHLKDEGEDVEYLIDLDEETEESEIGDVKEQEFESEDDDFELDIDLDAIDDTEVEDETDDEEVFTPMRKSHRVRKMKQFDEESGEDEVVDATVGPDATQEDIDKILDDIFAEGSEEESDEEETIYEIELDDDEDMDDAASLEEAFKPKKFKGKNPETKKVKGPTSMKPTMKKPTGKLFGKAPVMGKIEAKEGEEDSMDMEKMETKEAARTLGFGKKFGRKGLHKPITAPSHLKVEDTKAMKAELLTLREKNEEYRKALNIFREKLNEVAVFNSNLAYATRLFTEHSTSKQEKINILRRFDGIETLKESKSLYSTLRGELSSKSSTPITESIEKKVDKTPSSGSAINLIESKTYENPQFLRMKDLMNKIK